MTTAVSKVKFGGTEIARQRELSVPRSWGRDDLHSEQEKYQEGKKVMEGWVGPDRGALISLLDLI